MSNYNNHYQSPLSHEVEHQRGYFDNIDSNNNDRNTNNYQASSSRHTPYRKSSTWNRPGTEALPSRHSSKRPKKVNPPPTPKSHTNLYIKGLKEGDSDATLWKLVEEFGPVKTVKAMVKIVNGIQNCTGNH